MLGGAERPVEARARDLQVISAVEGIFNIEGRRDRPRERGAVVQGDAALLVEIDAEDLPAATAADLDVDQLHPFLGGGRRGQLPAPIEDLLFPSHPAAPLQ